MKILCDKKDIMRTAQTVARAIPARAVSPVLECLLIEAKDGKVTLMGTDAEQLSIKSSFEAKVESWGKIAVNARIFMEIISKYPESELVFETDDTTLFIKCGSSKSQIKHVDPTEYPDFPRLEEVVSVEMTSGELRYMINASIFSVSTNADKPVLTGMLFEEDDRGLNMVALDGYRLAMVRRDTVGGNRSLVVPARSLREISRILDDSDEKLLLRIGDTLSVEMGGTLLHTTAIREEYLKYRNILPTDYTTRIRADKAALLDALERASIMSRVSNNNLIRMALADDSVVITANSEFGNAYERIEVYMEGKNLEIGFNAKFLTDVLRNVEADELFLDFNTNISPCVIRPIEGDAFVYIVLPIQLRGE